MAKKRRTEKTPVTVSFDYIKSNYFRVIHVDGIFGGGVPAGTEPPRKKKARSTAEGAAGAF